MLTCYVRDIITKKNAKLFFLVMMFLFDIGCRAEKQAFLTDSIDSYLVDSTYIPERVTQNARFAHYESAGDSIVVFLERGKDKFCFFNIYTQRCIDSFQRGSSGSESGEITSFSLDKAESIYWVTNSNVLGMRFRNGLFKTYDLSPLLYKIDPKIACRTMNPVQKQGDNFIVTACFYEGDANGRPVYNSVMHYYDIIFRLDSDSLTYVAKYNPNTPDLIEQSYNSNLWRKRLAIPTGHMLYLYDFKDTLIAYNLQSGEVKKTKVLTTAFTPNPPFDDKNFHDENYHKSYIYGNSRFHSIMYNQKDDHTYIFLKHKDTYLTETGEKREYYDAAFSILLYNKSLKPEQELVIPSRKYNLMSKFILNGKLYIAEYKHNPAQNGKVKYYIFSIPGNSDS